jgi:hypothetical protein
MLLAIIAGCEVGFWVILLAGLTARYLLGLRRMGEALLVCVPLVDLVLLVATIRTCDAARAPTSPTGWPPPTSASRSPSAPASSAGSTRGSPTASPAARHHGRAGMGRDHARYGWQEFRKALGPGRSAARYCLAGSCRSATQRERPRCWAGLGG